MESPAVEIAEYIAAAGIGAGEFGGNAEWSTHATREPISPSNVLTVYDAPGSDPLVVDGADLQQPAIQVRARSADYEAAFAIQGEVYELLQQPQAAESAEPLERDIGAGRYVAINLVGAIMPIGRDDNDRHLVVANYRVIRQPLEGS
jgi:hypothetical protein